MISDELNVKFLITNFILHSVHTRFCQILQEIRKFWSMNFGDKTPQIYANSHTRAKPWTPLENNCLGAFLSLDTANIRVKSLRFLAQMTYMGDLEWLTFLDNKMYIDHSYVNNCEKSHFYRNEFSKLFK